MISFRSRMERMSERYSSARVWVCSERSVGSSEVANMEITIEIELFSTEH